MTFKKNTPTILRPGNTLPDGTFIVCNSGEIKTVDARIRKAVGHRMVKTFAV